MGKAKVFSRYNWLIEAENNHVVIANGLTGAMAVIDSDYQDQFRSHFRKGPCSASALLEKVDSCVVQNLLRGGFVIDTDFDERRSLEHHYYCQSYAEPKSLTIVPTMACNFGCSYCYQETGVSNSPSISDDVINRIAWIASSINSDDMHVSLTGGEPLLFPDRVIKLCNRVGEERAKANKRMNVNVITNGYTLTKDLLEELKICGINRMQITLDGNEQTHNSRRPLKNGDGTYKVVSENIILASQYMPVNVRVNCESVIDNQYSHVKKLFERYSSIVVTPAPTRYDHRNQTDLTRNNVEYLYCDLSLHTEEYCVRSFKPRIAGCAATRAYGMVILPDGATCKCWHEIAGNKSYRYGSIMEEPYNPFSDYSKYWKWMSFNPYNSEHICYNCDILPNCGGGCPADWVLEECRTCNHPELQNHFTGLLSEAAKRLLPQKLTEQGRRSS